jgi:hypothetical protein
MTMGFPSMIAIMPICENLALESLAMIADETRSLPRLNTISPSLN